VKIRRAIARDRSKPSRKFGRLAKRSEPRQRLKENVLHQIVDIRVRHSRQKDAMHHTRVPRITKSKSATVAALSGKNKRGVLTIGVKAGVHTEPTGEWSAQFKGSGHGTTREVPQVVDAQAKQSVNSARSRKQGRCDKCKKSGAGFLAGAGTSPNQPPETYQG
jgi:hypothetical protein